MIAAEQEITRCDLCGAALTRIATESGCLHCLLRAGLDDVCSDGNGTRRFQHYELCLREDGALHELGRGAMGVTYQALDTSLNRAVALKIIQSDLRVSNGETHERFMREARAAASLRHPNVATVYHFGIREESGQCFCAMELIEGETLDDRVRRTGPLNVRSAVEIARQIAAALAEAEKRGLVHRDLKPANIMIQSLEADEAKPSHLTVKIIDFGIAKALAETPDARVLTWNGFIGTPAFASPEQFAHAPVDVRSDIYSLGATLWYLLTGHMPFGDRVRGRNGYAAVAPPVHQLKAAGVPHSLRSLLVTMLAGEPAARPGVLDLTSRLERISAQVADSRRSVRRLVLTGALIALAAAAFFLVHFNNPRQTDETRSRINSAETRLAGPERHRAEAVGTSNPEAHEAYLKGRYFWNKRSLEGYEKAIGYMRHALELD
ncbi:MAG: serine/threonine protein kinase, partial [Verrucomicrobiota bacterium]|nr:serine/threonine protein kinase [Verrucomicrobiota bacterium]